MRKYLPISYIASAIILHARYFSWMIKQWHEHVDLIYPVAVVICSAYFLHISLRDTAKENGDPADPKITAVFMPLALLLTSFIIIILSFKTDLVWLGGFSLPIMLQAALYFGYGRRVALACSFSLYLLLLLNPLHQLIMPYASPYLNELVANSVGLLMKSIGVHTERSGLIVYTGKYFVKIVDGCNGLNSLYVVMLFAAILAQKTQDSLPPKLILFFSSLAYVFLANIARVAGMLYAGTFSEPGAALNLFHGPASLAIYLLMYPVLFVEALLIRHFWDRS